MTLREKSETRETLEFQHSSNIQAAMQVLHVDILQ